jgi:hypothetical protein
LHEHIEREREREREFSIHIVPILAASTLIILISEMLEFSKKNLRKNKICEGK